MFTSRGMSPRRFVQPAPTAASTAIGRFWSTLGVRLSDARRERGWSVDDLAKRAGLSRSLAYQAEAGRQTSVEAVIRLATALGLRLDADLANPRRRDDRPNLSRDPIHSSMGELEARRMRGFGFGVGIDEPYQHYRFAGRADLVALDIHRRAMLHIENRTRFPDLQETAGSYNAKRAYLANALGARLSVSWSSQTHVLAALWSAEVLHVLRLRTESFRALCPDASDRFEQWWPGSPPREGVSSSLVVLDPMARGRQHSFIDLEVALSAGPRYRGYADAAQRIAAVD